VLIYRCPKTDKVVKTSINTSEDEVRRLKTLELSLWCPYCQVGHAIMAKDVWVTSEAAQSAA